MLVGDLYRAEDESTEQLKKVYSDTELGKDGKNGQVLIKITMFNLP